MSVVGFYLFFGGIVAVGIGEGEDFRDFLVGFGLCGYFLIIHYYLSKEMPYYFPLYTIEISVFKAYKNTLNEVSSV